MVHYVLLWFNMIQDGCNMVKMLTCRKIICGMGFNVCFMWFEYDPNMFQ
jgi:hypothetical protein